MSDDGFCLKNLKSKLSEVLPIKSDLYSNYVQNKADQRPII